MLTELPHSSLCGCNIKNFFNTYFILKAESQKSRKEEEDLLFYRELGRIDENCIYMPKCINPFMHLIEE